MHVLCMSTTQRNEIQGNMQCCARQRNLMLGVGLVCISWPTNVVTICRTKNPGSRHSGTSLRREFTPQKDKSAWVENTSLPILTWRIGRAIARALRRWPWGRRRGARSAAARASTWRTTRHALGVAPHVSGLSRGHAGGGNVRTRRHMGLAQTTLPTCQPAARPTLCDVGFARRELRPVRSLRPKACP